MGGKAGQPRAREGEDGGEERQRQQVETQMEWERIHQAGLDL